MTAASLVSYLITSSPVIRDELPRQFVRYELVDFDLCRRAFPRFNGPSSVTASSGEIRLKLLLDELATICRNDPNSTDKFYFARLYVIPKTKFISLVFNFLFSIGLFFLNEFIKVTSINPNSYTIYSLITELQSVIGECEDDAVLSESDPTIFPELANLFGYGCTTHVQFCHTIKRFEPGTVV